MAKETLGTDLNNKVDYSLPAPVACYDIALTASMVATVTTPANYNRVFFSFGIGTNVWVTMDGTNPVVPSTGAFTTQELNPASRQIKYSGGQSLKFISDSASYVNIRYDLGAPSGGDQAGS